MYITYQVLTASPCICIVVCQFLSSRDVTQHGALAKQLADVLDFLLQFDYEKMIKTGTTTRVMSYAVACSIDRGLQAVDLFLVSYLLPSLSCHGSTFSLPLFSCL